MSSLKSDELERILHPVRDENYMEKYAEQQVELVHNALEAVERGEAVSFVEGEYWKEMESLNKWLVDQRGSLEWYTLTKGDTVRICTDDDPLPFFSSIENDKILENRYGIDRGVRSFSGMFKEVFSTERKIAYDPVIHSPDTVSQITREEHDSAIERDYRSGFINVIDDITGCGLDKAKDIFNSRRLLGYLCRDDSDVAPKAVLFAYDENWNLIHDGPVFNGYASQMLFVPFNKDHEAYDHVIEDLKEDMASRCELTLREGWPRP